MAILTPVVLEDINIIDIIISNKGFHVAQAG